MNHLEYLAHHGSPEQIIDAVTAFLGTIAESLAVVQHHVIQGNKDLALEAIEDLIIKLEKGYK